MEYLCNHLSDHAQILNLSLDDQTILYKSLKWRQPPVEDDLKILKVEYLSSHLLDPNQILNLSLDNQTMFYQSLTERQPQNFEISRYLSNHLLDHAQIYT